MESGDSPSEGVKGKALKPEIGELAAVVTCLSRCSPVAKGCDQDTRPCLRMRLYAYGMGSCIWTT